MSSGVVGGDGPDAEGLPRRAIVFRYSIPATE
jgi:hypothetical protein